MPDSSEVHEDVLLGSGKKKKSPKKKLVNGVKIWDNNYVTETDTVVEKFSSNHANATTVTFEGTPADVAAVRPNAEAALAAISAVVDVPLKNLTIVAAHGIPSSNGGTVNGFYRHDTHGQLTINATIPAETQQYTIIHEFGHLLEYEFLGNGEPVSQENLPPSYAMAKEGDSPWNRLGAAMARSQRMQMLFMNAQVFDDSWSVYATDPSEAFARAFAQYAGDSKGANSTVKDFLASQDAISNTGQWEADDFTGVGQAMGDLLNETGVGVGAATVSKFNQNHDDNGRFSSGVGGLSVTYTGDPDKIDAVKPEVEAALGIINNTVSVPGMKSLEIHVTEPESQGVPHEVRGWYTPGIDGVLNVSSHMDDPDMTRATILHEFGHLLDFEHLSRKGLPESEKYPSPSYKVMTDPSDTAWRAFGRKALMSNRVQDLFWNAQKGSQWAAYAQSPHEVFGRAFMQYAVNHSNDAKLKVWQQSYDAVQKSGQWLPADFAGIDKAMGDLLESEGIKAASITKFNPNHDGAGRFSSGVGGSFAVSAQASRLRQPDGGFILDLHTNREATKGYALSIHPERSHPVANVAHLTDTEIAGHVKQFTMANADLLSKRGNMLGAWHDPETGTAWLDVSTVVEDRAVARQLALTNDQIAFFDMGSGQSVDVNRLATSGQGVLKFNQNHDQNGRFSSGPGGSLGQSVHPAPGDLADMRASSITSKYVRADGSFTPERAALHDKIVSDFLRGVPSRDNPVEYFNGGGPGAGKSSMTQGVNGKLVGYPGVRHVDDVTGRMDFKGVPTPDAVLIDPDAVKLQLPEVRKAMREGDQTWAAEAHAESSYLSKRVMQAALDRKVHIVNDGTGDSGAAKMIAKAHQAKAAGYRTEANYLHLDPNEGVRRALARAKRSGRMVPPTVIRHTYAALPEVFGKVQEGVFDNVRLFDNDGVGVGQPARLIGATNNGHFEIFDQTAYNRFMAGN